MRTSFAATSMFALAFCGLASSGNAADSVFTLKCEIKNTTTRIESGHRNIGRTTDTTFVVTFDLNRMVWWSSSRKRILVPIKIADSHKLVLSKFDQSNFEEIDREEATYYSRYTSYGTTDEGYTDTKNGVIMVGRGDCQKIDLEPIPPSADFYKKRQQF